MSRICLNGLLTETKTELLIPGYYRSLTIAFNFVTLFRHQYEVDNYSRWNCNRYGLLRFNDLFSAVSCYIQWVGWEVSFACIINLIYFSGFHSYVGFFLLYRDTGRSERIVEQRRHIRRGWETFRFWTSGGPWESKGGNQPPWHLWERACII